MIAFGTLKKKSAFKLYARAKNMDFELANTISEQIGKYDEAVKNADDDERDEIDMYDYVDSQYKEYIEQSKNYWGVISDKKKAPSAYLLYDGNIRREIGLIKCKSESTKKEYITCVIDGMVAENYKFLKNDILKVDVVLLIDKVFKRIGIKHFDVNTLIDYVKNDDKVWDLYAKGYTIGLNQVEKPGSKQKCMNYKPHNISELSAFVAAIRPGFKSMYKRFENREDFSWGIPTLDNLLRTEELPVSFLFFQEQVMAVLNYAGFPMSDCYGAIKAIAKKHPEKVRPLKQKFIDGFRNKIIEDENLSIEKAQINAEKVWQIVNDNCGYSFNSSHAYCMALDSLYQAWQKAHYPYEFYEVLLQHYSDKGNKYKVSLLRSEMKTAFGIEEGQYRFRDDNRKFTTDVENHRITPSLASIKNISQKVADELYSLKNNKYNNFIELLNDLQKTSVDSRKLEILLHLDFFKEFGDMNCLAKQVELYNTIHGKKQFKINQLDELHIPFDTIKKYAGKITEKIIKDVDTDALLDELIRTVEYKPATPLDHIRNEMELLGYTSYTIPTIDEDYYFVMKIDRKIAELYNLQSGKTTKIKIRNSKLETPKAGDMIKVLEIRNERKWRKDENGKWYQIDERENVITKYSFVK